MNKGLKLFAFLAFLLLSSSPLMAQSGSGTPRGLIVGLIVIGALILLWAIISIADNLLQVEADKAGIDTEKENMSLFPRIKEFVKPTKPSFVKDYDYKHLRRGFNINLAGKAEGSIKDAEGITRFSVSPYNFRGIAPIPKVVVEPGSEVKAGDILFYDKGNPDIKYVSPVSGEIVDVKRGAKRSISDVIILADKEQKYRELNVPDLNKVSREELVAFLADSGAWSYFNQRPFDVIPALDSVPRDIFISTFNSAPLAPDYSKIVEGSESAFQKGIDVLTKMTSGKVHLGLDGKKNGSGQKYLSVNNAEKHFFNGPHPAGNVGIQIHHINPININDAVWTLDLQEVIALGNMFINGHFDGSRIVAITGAEIKNPKYVRTYQGANIGELISGNLENDHVRYVSGDVLSGQSKSAEEFLNFRDNQVTVIEEGDEYEMFGWLLPLAPRPSVSKTFPSFLYPNLKFRANTNTHGEDRAFVVSGQYEKVLPMDIYPQALMKAIMTEDLEKMEGLGIAELTEEDIALCEFVCTSKAPLQQLLREGLDMIREQL